MKSVEASAERLGTGDGVAGVYTVVNPANGSEIARVPDMGAHEAARAVEASVEAFDMWKRSTAYSRSAVVERWHQLILEAEGDLAELITAEMGKPIREARSEVQYAAGFVKWYAEEAKRVYGETVPSQHEHKRLTVIKQAVGPVLAITPWNFPAAMVTRKAAPALAAGCTVILKPATQTPLTALKLAELWRQAGGPENTFTVLTTTQPQTVADVALDSAEVRKLTFTGSTTVGKLLAEKAAKTVKRVSLELGGHAPFIVFEDADISKAVQGAIASKYRNAGQTCVCANRIFVQSGAVDEFTELFARETQGLRVGEPSQEDTDIGPLIDERGLAKAKQHVDDAVANGASVVVGGRNTTGLFFEPTVLRGVTGNMLIMQEETFGPVAPIVSFETEDEVVDMANSTPYGLAAYVFTTDLARSVRMAERLEYGIVGINDGTPSTPQVPFGGVKDSGIGREGGKWGIEEYLDVKLLSVDIG